MYRFKCVACQGAVGADKSDEKHVSPIVQQGGSSLLSTRLPGAEVLHSPHHLLVCSLCATIQPEHGREWDTYRPAVGLSAGLPAYYLGICGASVSL